MHSPDLFADDLSAGTRRRQDHKGCILPRRSLLLRMVRSEPRSLGAGIHFPSWVRVKSAARTLKAIIECYAKGQKGKACNSDVSKSHHQIVPTYISGRRNIQSPRSVSRPHLRLTGRTMANRPFCTDSTSELLLSSRYSKYRYKRYR